jgi:hypothetical protein
LCEDGRFGCSDEWLVGEDEVEVIIELDEEAIQDDPNDGHVGVVSIVVDV